MVHANYAVDLRILVFLSRKDFLPVKKTAKKMAMSRPKCLNKHSLLTVLTILGVVGGTVTGLLLNNFSTREWTKREVMYMKYPGDLFLRILKSLIIPLLTSSIISAIGSLDLSLSKKIAFRSIVYYSTTTICAVVLGIILVTTIKPGVGVGDVKNVKQVKDNRVSLTTDTIMDLVRNMFPPNLVEATIGQSHVRIKVPEHFKDNPRFSNKTFNLKDDYQFWDFEEVLELRTTNILGLVVFSIVMGIAVGQIGERGKILVAFFDSLSKVMMIITCWVIWLSPIGVFFLVIAQIMEVTSFITLLAQLGFYFGTVLLGLFLHCFGTLTVVYFVCTRTLPFRTIAGLSQVLTTAFGTASSSATMPLTIQALDDLGLDPRVTRFVIPIGAMCNLDGTALYEAVAAIFIAQRNAIELGIGQTAAICVTATAASIGAAGIPQAGLVTMVMVLDAVGLPAEQISIILAVDWLLDRFRTTINVLGDCLGAKIVNTLSKSDLRLWVRKKEPTNCCMNTSLKAAKRTNDTITETNTGQLLEIHKITKNETHNVLLGNKNELVKSTRLETCHMEIGRLADEIIDRKSI
ncbi:hypothetical protein RN001_000865 [Aquatica leii]|uniref:Amino acid transporter n=1 Tax=Aquatica leii TaxID=1421715 RepID=A0AAN7SKV2_9COLE|nr:hypothetical protein RN001_000865 [Aquatica leii]